jgi:hypothetical protein
MSDVKLKISALRWYGHVERRKEGRRIAKNVVLWSEGEGGEEQACQRKTY